MNPEKNRRKIIWSMIISLTLIVSFLYIYSTPSPLFDANNEVKKCNTVECVKSIWENSEKSLQKNKIFIQTIRNQLHSFQLSPTEINTCQKWLPAPPKSTNIIIVPELSSRLKKDSWQEDQVKRDKHIIWEILRIFQTQTESKPHSKDKLILTISDYGQADRKFERIADGLIYNLESETIKSNRQYFTKSRKDKFYKNINTMQDYGIKAPSEANYFNFIEDRLPLYLKKNTLFHHFENKVIFITDGYIEEGKIWGNAPFYGFEDSLVGSQDSQKSILAIKEINLDLSNTSFLVCEINAQNERQIPLLKQQWEIWLQSLHPKSVTVSEHLPALESTKDVIRNFISGP